jgi:hypothetical protein
MRWLSTSSRIKAGSNFDHCSRRCFRSSGDSDASSCSISFRSAGSIAAALKPLLPGLSAELASADLVASSFEPDESPSAATWSAGFSGFALSGDEEACDVLDPCIQPKGLKVCGAVHPQ